MSVYSCFREFPGGGHIQPEASPLRHPGASRGLKLALSSLILAAIALVGMSTFQHAIAQTGGSAKKPAAGIMYLTDYRPDGLSGTPYDNPAVDGVIFRAAWMITEPQNNVYDWRQIDNLVAAAKRSGKTFGLGMVAGFRSPEWFLNSGAITLTTTFDPNYAQQRRITQPVPWDPAFQKHWGQFLKVMAERYDAEPNVSYVLIAGLGRAFEPFMARSPEDVLAFEALGGLPKWTEGAKAVIDLYARHFRKTPFIMTMHYPVPSPEGRRALENVVNYGLRTYPGRFGVKYDALDAVASTKEYFNSTILEWSGRTPVGYQMVWSSTGINAGWLRGTLAESLQRGVANKAHFVEVYAVDCDDPKYADLLKSTSKGLKANAAALR